MLKGIWIHPKFPAAEIVERVVELEAAGLDQVWIGDEGVARDPFVLLSSCAMRTSRIELGIAVTNPILRHPGIVASSAATIAEISGDRMILGWGTGGAESLQPFGLTVDSPARTLERALQIAASVFERREGLGYSPPLHAMPARHVKQYVGARGPRLNELASTMADGVFLSGLDEADLPDRIDRARSKRRIEVTICQTVLMSGEQSPGTMTGSTTSIAERLSKMVGSFLPRSVCVACIDDVPLRGQLDFAMEIFEKLDRLEP